MRMMEICGERWTIGVFLSKMPDKKTYAAFFIIRHKQGICLWRQRCARKCGRINISAAWPGSRKRPAGTLGGIAVACPQKREGIGLRIEKGVEAQTEAQTKKTHSFPFARNCYPTEFKREILA
jgi:hypothetical protein